jgi:2-dehydropantoate 2-reductase
MRIAVLGAGAIGCLFGFRLDESGQDVLLIHHDSSTVRTLNKNGVLLRELSGKVSKRRIRAKQFLLEKDDSDLVLLTVKAYDTPRAVEPLQSWTSMPNLGILSLQNGLGNTEVVSSLLPATLVVGGSTTDGALQTNPGRIAHTGRGSTWIGELNGKPSERCSAIKHVFRRAGFRTEISDNIRGVIWSKAIVNSAINPISALTGAKNGDLLVIPALRNLTERVVEESYAVSRAKGIRARPSPKPLLKGILRLAASNRSSMLQDIRAGRKTEIQQLNGQIVKEGTRQGVPTPYNKLLLDLVTGLEALNEKS